jgi:cytochrome o ubiquinol oxidase subunit 2
VTKGRLLFFLLVGLDILLLIVLLFYWRDIDFNVQVLNPQGQIADKQRELMLIAALLMLIVVIPVYLMTFYIAYKYRAGNKKAKYSPNWDGNRKIEIAWWAIPGVIITILAVITFQSSHALDPVKKLDSRVKPLPVQVVALDWKWLFIYPEQNIASVNHLQFPVNTPIDFEITADAPMNSFWIPQLGGQIYAMSGMATELHLEAAKAGDYYGSSANISGRGFARMVFTARASNRADFEQWVASAKGSLEPLNQKSYAELAQPYTLDQPVYYSSVEDGLFYGVLSKFYPYADIKQQHPSIHGSEGH